MTDEEMAKVCGTLRTWPADDAVGALEVLIRCWAHPAMCGRTSDRACRFRHGNLLMHHELLLALQENDAWWSLYWLGSTREGVLFATGLEPPTVTLEWGPG